MLSLAIFLGLPAHCWGLGLFYRMGVSEPDGDFVQVSVDPAQSQVPVIRRVHTALGVLHANQNVVVAGAAWSSPVNILRALRADLRSGRSQSWIDAVERLISQMPQPVACPVNRALIICDADTATHWNTWGFPGISAILPEVSAEIRLEIDAHGFNARTFCAAQVKMPAAEVEHILQELLERESGDPDGVSAGQDLWIVPAAWTDHRSDHTPLN